MLQYLLLLETEREKEFFKKIYKQYRTEMFYTAYKIVKNGSDAEDIVHETFLTLIDHLDKLIDNEPHKTWNYIMTAVRHKSYNLWRRKKIQKEIKLEDWEWGQEEIFVKSTDMIVEEAEQKNSIVELVKQMKSPYQEVLLMQYYHDMNVQEIAELLEKTPDNIRHISSRAKKKLHLMLEETGILNE